MSLSKSSLIKLVLLVFGLLPFFSPGTVLAGSCSCRYNAAENAGSATACIKKGEADSTDYCSGLNGSSDGYGSYDLCTFYSNDECKNSCEMQNLKMDTKSPASCSVDADCAEKTNNIGVAKCCDQQCYFDDVGMQAYLNARVGFTQVKLQAPKLEIRIPGIQFTAPNNSIDQQGYIHVQFLAQYLAGIYKFSMGAASILAAIVIILNGFRISISMGGDQKSQAIKKIGQTVIGLCILWGSYLLFYTINPELTQFRALQVKYITPPPPEAEEEITAPTPVVAEANVVTPYGDNLVAAPGVTIDSALLPALQAAAASLKADGINLYITSGLRTKEKQLQLIKDNCESPAGSSQCNPKPGKPPTCILKDMKLENCPHTTGKAVDVWGRKQGNQCISQSSCSKDPATDACHNDPCQKAVISAMKAQKFCNLRSEAWHFEMPQMSSACNF